MNPRQPKKKAWVRPEKKGLWKEKKERGARLEQGGKRK